MNIAFVSTVLVDRIGWLLIHSLWQFTLVAFAVMVILRMMRRSTAAVRYWTCVAAMAATVIILAATWQFLPADIPQPEAIGNELLATIGSIPADSELPALVNSVRPTIEHPPVEAPVNPAEPIAASSVRAAAAEPATPWLTHFAAAISGWLEELVALWCLGVLLFALRPLGSWYMLYP